jgi:hypothetical protein
MTCALVHLWLAASLAATIPAREDTAKNVQELVVTLKSEKPSERAAAARILGEIGPPAKDALKALKKKKG